MHFFRESALFASRKFFAVPVGHFPSRETAGRLFCFHKSIFLFEEIMPATTWREGTCKTRAKFRPKCGTENADGGL